MSRIDPLDLRVTLETLVRDGHRLSLRQLTIFLVCHTESAPQTVTGLADRLRVKKPVITQALDVLCDRGLLERLPAPDTGDQRTMLIGNTGAGADFFAQAIEGRPPARVAA